MDLLAGLNSQQHHAVTAAPGPTLIIAGPGSGKTRVLTHRIAYLISHLGVAPRSIMAVTFTNRAAKEMKHRVETLLEGQLRGLTIGTFHAICARLLRREAEHLPVNSDFVIFDDSDQQALVKQILKERNLNDKQYTPQKLLNRISGAKNELIGPDEFAAHTYFAEIAKRVYQDYQKALIANNALDFDDLLMGVVQLFEKRPEVLAKYQRYYAHILVDEFQDTNTAQYALLRHLAAAHRSLYVVGDPDQGVYRWRGADYRNVRKFQADYADAQTILLEQNYRSTQVILDAAMAVIDRHPGRTRKQLFTERQGGVELETHEAYNEQDEAQFAIDTIHQLTVTRKYALGDFAVMYRTNAQSRAVEDAFVRANVPYKLVGAQRFYGRKEVKDVLAYLRLIHNPADGVSLMRVINTPPRGLGAKTLEQLTAAAQSANLPATELLRDLAERGKESPYAHTFTGKAGAALANFGLMLNHWLAAKSDLSVAQLFDTVLDRIDYRDYLLAEGDDEAQERWENVLELRGVAAAAPEVSLTDFLQEVALVSDQDTITEEGKAVTLLTLHAAKGLEFPVVFIVGLDEGVLPHQRSFDDPESMHEERRLMYVGMTRAKDRLYLVRAFRRTLFGDSSLGDASRFLSEIPPHLLKGTIPRKQASAERYFQRATQWEADDDEDDRPARSTRSRDSAPRPSSPPMSRPPSTPKRALTPHFKSGQRVRHAQFGEGIVIDSRVYGDEEEVNIAFDEVGLKRLAASVAKLEVIGK
jgi:DNA helicase-2/ATP-dependent DNA helicase PcrA